MKLIFILSSLINLLYLSTTTTTAAKSFSVGLRSDVHRSILFQTWYRVYWALHFNTSLDDIDLYSRSQLYDKIKNFCTCFLQILSIDLGEIQWAATVCLLKPVLNLFPSINILGREFSVGDFIKYTFSITLHSDTYSLILSKPGMMINTTKPNGSIPILMTLTFTLGHKVMGKAGFCAIVLLQSGIR